MGEVSFYDPANQSAVNAAAAVSATRTAESSNTRSLTQKQLLCRGGLFSLVPQPTWYMKVGAIPAKMEKSSELIRIGACMIASFPKTCAALSSAICSSEGWFTFGVLGVLLLYYRFK